jgi:hypothetical protein
MSSKWTCLSAANASAIASALYLSLEIISSTFSPIKLFCFLLSPGSAVKKYSFCFASFWACVVVPAPSPPSITTNFPA